MVSYYLKKYSLSVCVATVFSLLLALISSALGLCFGPALKVLSDQTPREIPLKDLLGSNIAKVAEFFVDNTEVSSMVLLTYLPFAIVIAACFKSLFDFGQTFLWKRIGEKTARGIRGAIVKSYIYVDPDVRHKSGFHKFEENLSAFMSRDIKLISEYIISFYGNVPKEVMQNVIFIVILIALSWKFTALFLLGIFPCLFVVNRLGRSLRKKSSQVLRDSSQLTEWLQHRLTGIETIKHYKTESTETQKMDSILGEMRLKLIRAARVNALSSPMIETVAIVAIAAILYFILKDVQENVATGAVFISYFSILFMMSQSIGRLVRYFNKNREASAAIQRVIDTEKEFKVNELKQLHTEPSLNAPQVIAENLSFAYEQGDGSIERFSYTFNAGKIYTICGDSGAGKSTLARMLLGIIKPHAGVVKIDKDLTWAYVPQTLKLMPASIFENIVFPDKNYKAKSVNSALHHLNLQSLIEHQPDPKEVLVGDGGMQLSGGQIQRLLIARLLYHHPKYILLDEATSALDPQSESLVLRHLKDLAHHGSLVIMVAHRRAAVDFADEVIVMENGKIALAGNKSEVCAHPVFKNLFLSDDKERK